MAQKPYKTPTNPPKNGANMLSGYCLYKDGQLQVPPPEKLQPPQQQPPMAQPPQEYYNQPPTDNNPPQVGSDGKCCPQASPISINITNSQDRNSRNVQTRSPRQATANQANANQVRRTRPHYHQPPVRERVVVKKVLQPVPLVRTRTIVRDVPRDVVREVPVIKNTYTERVLRIPVTGCEGKEFIYPAWF